MKRIKNKFDWRKKLTNNNLNEEKERNKIRKIYKKMSQGGNERIRSWKKKWK